MQAMMKTKKIRIPDFYNHTQPKKEKINKHMLYYLENGTLSSSIVVTQKGMLIDGYCDYIVAVVCGISAVQCQVNTKKLKHSIRKRNHNRSIKYRAQKRKILYNRQAGKCAICGKQLQIDDHTSIEDYFTLDHILPVSRGGSNGLDNLQGLCMQCNHEKDNDYDED